MDRINYAGNLLAVVVVVGLLLALGFAFASNAPKHEARFLMLTKWTALGTTSVGFVGAVVLTYLRYRANHG